jgi:hypothetical protein
MQVQRTMPSIAWLMPSPLFWKPNEVLVQTDSKNYSLSNLEELFMYMKIQTHFLKKGKLLFDLIKFSFVVVIWITQLGGK